MKKEILPITLLIVALFLGVATFLTNLPNPSPKIRKYLVIWTAQTPEGTRAGCGVVNSDREISTINNKDLGLVIDVITAYHTNLSVVITDIVPLEDVQAK